MVDFGATIFLCFGLFLLHLLFGSVDRLFELLAFFLVGNGRILYFCRLGFLFLSFLRLNFIDVWAGILLLFGFVVGASFLLKMVSVVSAGTSFVLKTAALWPADGFFSVVAPFVSRFGSLCPLVASDLLPFPLLWLFAGNPIVFL